MGYGIILTDPLSSYVHRHHKQFHILKTIYKFSGWQSFLSIPKNVLKREK